MMSTVDGGASTLFKWDATSSKLALKTLNEWEKVTSEIGIVEHKINIRLDHPIQGCELKPRVYLFSTQKTSTGISNKAYPKSDHTFEFKWYRGPKIQACANIKCPKSNSFNPLDWSSYSSKGYRLQCAICCKLKIQKHRSIFCNSFCFKQAWKDHCASHDISKMHVECSTMLLSELEGADEKDESDNTNDSEHLSIIENEDEDEEAEEENPELNPAAEADKNNESVVNSLLKINNAVHELSDTIIDSDWVHISSNRWFIPSSSDVGRYLKLECRAVLPDKSLVCDPKYLITEPVLSTPPPPPQRTSIGPSKLQNSSNLARFRIVSYNLLAEIYSTQLAYPNCDSWALGWSYRRENLSREIISVCPDMMCLQEVQADSFKTYFQPLFDKEGFDGVYKAKTRESMGMLGKVDGCALFWRRNRFRLVENYGIEFNECAKRAATASGRGTERISQYMHRLAKDNIAQIAVLELMQKPRMGRIAKSPRLCVANTHLYSNPEQPDVKLWQCHTLLKELQHFVMSRDVHLVIAGDFNSQPDSAVYELLSMQRVSANHPTVLNDPCKVLPEISELSHSLPLQSSYLELCGDEPPYTNFTDNFKGTIDYIWHSMPDIRSMSVLEIPKREDILTCGRSMPNVTASSDHIMLCADLQVLHV